MDKYYNRLSLDDMNYYTPVTVDRAGIESIRSEERAARVWHHKWSWIIDEYRKIYDELKALKSEKADLAHVVLVAEDNRTMRPYPETTSGDYGHLATRPEFVLEKFSSPGLTPLKKKLTHADVYKALNERLTTRFGSTKETYGCLNYYKKTTKPKYNNNQFKLAMMSIL
ncbi:uncharacterized protein [Halyomorpha halys]|uniref:uncharacterized protein n=1 Tax=Halyomorpha halys TaxID=286706 RepID=UPI0006D5208B